MSRVGSNESKRLSAPLFLKLVTPQLIAGRPRKLAPAKRSVFVLSTGRTGTVFLAGLLDQVSSVISAHEPKPSRVLNAWTTAYLEDKVSDKFMAAVLANKRRRLAATNKDIYIEMNNFIAGFAEAASEVFENASVIHIVRDPRDFITSLTNRGDDEGIRKFFNKYVPHWAYVPRGVKKRNLDAFSRAAYRWVAINQCLSDWGKRNPDRYHFFKFEDILDHKDPHKIDPVLEAIGLTKKQIKELNYTPEPHYQKVKFSLIDRPIDASNTSSRQAMAKWRDWRDNDKKRVAEICGPLMKQYGYGGEPEWLAAL